MSPDLLSDKAPALDSVDGTEIEWKPSKNLCVAEIRKKQKNKNSKKKDQVCIVVQFLFDSSLTSLCIVSPSCRFAM